MVVDLLDIIDTNYRLYLASLVSLLLGYQGNLVIVDGDSSFSGAGMKDLKSTRLA